MGKTEAVSDIKRVVRLGESMSRPGLFVVYGTILETHLSTILDALEGRQTIDEIRAGVVESSAKAAALATQPQATYIAELERRLGECEGALETQTKVYDGKPQEVQKPVYLGPQPEQVAQDGGWKDHQTAAVINELTRVARQWHGTEQLRERIKEAADPLIRAARTRGEGA